MLELTKAAATRRGESEAETIGSMLLDRTGEIVDAVSEIVGEQHFIDEAAQTLFRHIVAARRDGREWSPDVIAREVDFQIVPAERIVEFFSIVPHAHNGAYYARSVFEAWQLRQTSEAVREMADELSANGSDISEALTRHIAKCDRIASERVEAKVDSFAELVNKVAANEDEGAGITSGIHSLDKYLKGGGFRPKQLVCVGARPSVGKTSLLTGFALAAAKNDVPALVLSLEMDALQIARRIVAQSGVRLEDDYDRERFGYTPLHIRDCAGWPLERIETAVRTLRRKDGVRLVVVDYLGLIERPKTAGKPRPGWEALGDMTRGLKKLAMAEDVCVIIAQQFNRQVENRNTRRPQMSDFRESGSIEQDADILIGLDREIRPNQEDTPDKGMIYLMKQRNGALADIAVAYDCERTLFKDAEIPEWS